MTLDRAQMYMPPFEKAYGERCWAVSILETWIKDLDHSINSLILDVCAVTPGNRFDQALN